MTYTHLNHSWEPLVENDDMDVETEFYNIPDTRIIDMLEEAYSDSE